MSIPNLFQNPARLSDEDGEEEDDDYLSTGPRRYFPDDYLDSPILMTHRTRWLAAAIVPPTDKDKDKMFYNVYRDVIKAIKDIHDYTIIDPEEYPGIYRHNWPTTLTTELTEAWGVAHSIRDSASEAFKKRTGCKLPKVTRQISDDAAYWFSRWSYFDSIVQEYTKVCTRSGPNIVNIHLGNHTTVTATKDIWFHSYTPIGEVKSVKRMWTYDQWLMVKDVLFTRAQVSLAASVFYPDTPTIMPLIRQLYRWHENCLLRHGNRGYEILKQSEALSKAFMSELTDPYFQVDGPYIRMLAKVRAKEDKMRDKDDPMPYLADMFNTWMRSTTDIQSVVEIFGLLKVSGHPLIDPALGGTSAAGEARSPDPTLYHDAERIDWEFKRTVLQAYIEKEGRWPTGLVFSESGQNTGLKRLYRRQVRHLDRNSYPLSDWAHCRFGPIVEFDYSPNYLDLIDDKSISLYRTNAAAFWDHDVKPVSQRRLLMELISRDSLDIRAIVNTVVERKVPFDWLIVSLHPKEREFKLEPRMFSMLVLEIRIFFALAEANIADKIFPYLPQQTMTKSKNEIGRQFLDMTRPVKDDEALRLFLEIDLSRWNLRWRQLVIGMIGRTLNDMFGVVGIFDYVHEFFSSAMIMVRVPGLRPDGIELPHPPETELLWYDHLGGFEGIAQKVWTIPTYMGMSLALNDLPLSYILQGQADNQIASLMIAREHGVTAADTLYKYRDIVTERISNRFAEVNQEVKVEECIESTSVITYSKDVYVNGVYRPTTLKFHSRLYPHSSQTFPSVRTNIGAIFSTAMAGAEKSVDPTKSHFLACVHSAMYMNRISFSRGCFGRQVNLIRRSLDNRWSGFLEMCLTLPSECGGFPIIPLIGFIYKGGSDPLSKSVSCMVMMGLDGDSRVQSRMLRQIQDSNMYHPTPRIEALFLDPFSVPFRKPPTSTDGVASETIKALSGRINIKDIASLMQSDTREYMSELATVLGKCHPMNPLIIRDILDCSVAGIADTISRMFVATRTLQDVVRKMKIPIVDRVLHLEGRGLIYMYERYVTLPNDLPFPTTAYDLTEAMRARWFPGETNPIVGLTSYQPFDFPISWGAEGMSREGITATLIAETDPATTRGPYDPYIGSKTREKRSEHGFKVVGTDTASTALRKLQLIASQTGKDPGFLKILDVVGWSRTNTQLSVISDQLPGMSGGNMVHRYASRAGHQDAFNTGSPNYATHCVVTTDNTGYLSGGALDYAIMFQEFILVAIWLTQLRWFTTGHRSISATIVTEGSSLRPLPSVSIIAPDEFSLSVLRFPDNPLTFIPHLKLERVSGALSHPAVPLHEHVTGDVILVRHALEEFFRSALRKSSKGRQIADGSYHHYTVDSLDIAEIASVGVDRVSRAIAFVAAEETISNYMMTHSIRKDRWRPKVMITKLVEAMAQTVTPMLGHPLMLQDAVVRKYYLYDGPTYLGGTFAAHNRYVSYVSQIAMMCLDGDSPSFSHRSVGIFVSSSTRSSPELMLSCFLSDLYLWEREQTITTDTVRKVIGEGLMPTLRKSKDDDDRLRHLVRSILVTSAAFRRQGLISPSKTLQSLASGGRIKSYRVTNKDILKAMRDSHAWGLISYPSKKSVPVIWDTAAIRPREFTTLTWSSTVTGYRKLSPNTSGKKERLIQNYQRNLGRTFEASGTSLYFWSAYASLFDPRYPVLVVGTGPGAVARIALDKGCPHVYGLDLRSSVPMKAHRFISYKPPLVMSSEYHSRYTQASETYTTSGNWLESEVARKFLLYDPGPGTLVIDVQQGESRFGTEVLAPAMKWKTAGVIIVRLYLSLEEVTGIMADFKASAIIAHVFDDGSAHVVPRVFVLSRWSKTLMTTLSSTGTSVSYPVTMADVSCHEVNRLHISMTMAEAIFHAVPVLLTDTTESVQSRLEEMIVKSLGEYESRFDYRRWTSLLQAMVVVRWMSTGRDRALGYLLRLADMTTVPIIIGGLQYDILVTDGLLRHMSTVGARSL